MKAKGEDPSSFRRRWHPSFVVSSLQPCFLFSTPSIQPDPFWFCLLSVVFFCLRAFFVSCFKSYPCSDDKGTWTSSGDVSPKGSTPNVVGVHVAMISEKKQGRKKGKKPAIIPKKKRKEITPLTIQDQVGLQVYDRDDKDGTRVCPDLYSTRFERWVRGIRQNKKASTNRTRWSLKH